MSGRELVERGIRAFGRGKLGEAERCWRDALAADPADARARAYLEQLIGRPGDLASSLPSAPVPLPSPGSARPARGRPASPAADGAVPLPAPLGAASYLASPRAVPPARDPPASAPPTNPMARPELSPRFAPAVTMAAYPRALLDLAAEAPPEVRPRPDDPFLLASAAPARAHTTLAEYAPSPWDDGPRGPAVLIDDGVGLDLSSVEDQSGIRPLVPESGPDQLRPTSTPRNEVEVWMVGARELFALGDFSGSLEMIEKILKVDPSHEEARTYLAQNEATLIAMYESKLGPQDAVPRLAIQPEEVMWLNLDHRAGFLLAQIDGAISYEDLFALSGLPRLDTARILAALLQEGVISA